MSPLLPRRALAAACLVALSLGSGCAGVSWPFFRGDGYGGAFTEEDLDSEVSAYVSRFAALIGDTAGDIHDRTTDRTLRKRALVWTLEIPDALETAVYDSPPRLAYVACVLIATAQYRYLVDGEGKDLFGALQPLAVQTGKTLLEDALAIGNEFLPASRVTDIAARAEDLAQRYPIRGRDFSMQHVPRAKVRAEATQSFGWLFTLPLAPFKALQGVDTGAAAIRDFNQTAQEFAQIAARLPERVRGQLELFLYDLEDRETVQRGVDALDRVGASAERASLAVDRLPDDLRQTLLESQTTVDALGRIVTETQTLAGPLADAARNLELASAHWLTVLGPKDATPRSPDDRPFDVRDWQAAADSIGRAAGELRGLAANLEAVQGATLDAAVDRLFWRSAALIALFFAALLAYRVLVARLARSRG